MNQLPSTLASEQHKKEPWSVKDPWHVFGREIYATDGSRVCEDASEADARRIVACVNACAGISTDSLERAGGLAEINVRQRLLAAEIKRDQLAAALSATVDQRDKLLAELIEAREALQFADDTPNGPICDTIWMMHRPETLFDFMDAAIASVEDNQFRDATKMSGATITTTNPEAE